MTLILYLHHWDQGLRKNKTESLQEIYEQGDKIDLQSNFCLFVQDPIYFEDAIKEKQ